LIPDSINELQGKINHLLAPKNSHQEINNTSQIVGSSKKIDRKIGIPELLSP